MVSLSRRAEHCRPATSILCGFQATELALNTYNRFPKLQYVSLLLLKECIYCIWNPYYQPTYQPLSSDVCVAWKQAHSLPRQPEKNNTNNKNPMTDISLSVKQTLLKNEDGEHTQIVSSTGVTHVNMHPEVVFFADICYAVQWIERTLHCGP